MAALVIAEHDNASIKGATLNTVTAARAVRRRRARAGGRPERRRRRQGRRADRRRGQGAARRRASSSRTGWPRTSPRRCSRSPRATATSCSRPPPAARTSRRASPRKLDVAQISRHHQGRRRRHLRAADLRRQRDRHGAERSTPSRSITVRTTGFDAAAASGGSRGGREGRGAGADSGKSSFLGSEIAKTDRPELTARQGRRLRRPRAGLAPRSSTRC